jgi:hypothetical protein
LLLLSLLKLSLLPLLLFVCFLAVPMEAEAEEWNDRWQSPKKKGSGIIAGYCRGVYAYPRLY